LGGRLIKAVFFVNKADAGLAEWPESSGIFQDSQRETGKPVNIKEIGQ
jgi:hypothetical protein